LPHAKENCPRPRARRRASLCTETREGAALEALERDDPTLAEPFHPALPYTGAQVIFAAREELARTVDDVLARRTRALFHDAAAARAAAPAVATLLARALHRDEAWQADQIAAFAAIADQDVPAGV